MSAPSTPAIKSSTFRTAVRDFGGVVQLEKWMTDRRNEGYSWEGVAVAISKATSLPDDTPSEQTVINWAQAFGLETGRIKREI